MGEWNGVIGGVESMMSAGFTPWHGLSDSKIRVEDRVEPKVALELAGIDWNVVMREVGVVNGFGYFSEAEAFKAVVRDTDEAVLGIHGKGYEPIQNAVLAELAEATQAISSQVQVESAGSLYGGRVIWMLVRTDDDRQLSAGETLQPYLLLHTSHDASYALGGRCTSVRVECMNTFGAAMYRGKSEFTVRHTVSASDYIADAKRLLKGSFDAQERLVADIEKLIRMPCGPLEYQTRIVPAIIGPEPTDTQRKRDNWDARKAQLLSSYERDDTSNVRGTAWNALNAVNSWELWDQGVRGDRKTATAKRLLQNRSFPATRKARGMLLG